MHRGPGIELWRIARVKGEQAPGRLCPVSYRYSPHVFDRPPEIEAETLFVVGGLYGNIEALDALRSMVAREGDGATIVFNGDFHWFDVRSADFGRIAAEVGRHRALRGNVETEISAEDSGAGCGCAYPVDVSDAEVMRSNEILARLRETARAAPAIRAGLRGLPMHLTARVGEARIGIVHGDAWSLAGWGFAHDRLDEPDHHRWLESAFRDAKVDIFSSTHTCLPAFRRLGFEFGERAVANNGAAGMPNFTGTRFGLATRISVKATDATERLFGLEVGNVHVDAMRIDYDHERWVDRFLASWPDGSPAHASYFRRICQGPNYPVVSPAPFVRAA